MALSTGMVDAVLRVWADSFIEDVPATHEYGKYFIEYDVLVDHLNNLSYDTLVNIMLEVEAEANYFGD